MSVRFINFLKSAVDLRDVFVFGGLLLMGVGLWMYEPWVSLTVIGSILVVFGLMAGRI
jgi:hypothetical protein